ncbi:hypothetical protein KEH51_08405 [[Brevibacterium] frigoritolerans]|uniref:YfkB-like domain-containing protein n=1 Tax=Peribacillus frigoritolerans TaxID=450367 RepID=A0A941J7C3_9BACI|nr:hypothetical protein [Peribacillus frigoritolerans]
MTVEHQYFHRGSYRDRFWDAPTLGNIKDQPLTKSYETWMNSKLANELNCHCPAVKCLGPNVLVKNAYYPKEDFRIRKSTI